VERVQSLQRGLEAVQALELVQGVLGLAVRVRRGQEAGDVLVGPAVPLAVPIPVPLAVPNALLPLVVLRAVVHIHEVARLRRVRGIVAICHSCARARRCRRLLEERREGSGRGRSGGGRCINIVK